jgi:hypothetical protein
LDLNLPIEITLYFLGFYLSVALSDEAKCSTAG